MIGHIRSLTTEEEGVHGMEYSWMSLKMKMLHVANTGPVVHIRRRWNIHGRLTIRLASVSVLQIRGLIRVTAVSVVIAKAFPLRVYTVARAIARSTDMRAWFGSSFTIESSST